MTARTNSAIVTTELARPQTYLSIVQTQTLKIISERAHTAALAGLWADHEASANVAAYVRQLRQSRKAA